MYDYSPEILAILKEGNFTKVRQLFVLTDDNIEYIYQKFELWCFVFTPLVFKREEAEEHAILKQNLCDLYLGKITSDTEIAFRGFAKTTYAKLFVAFVLANDSRKSRRKYFKIVAEDQINSVQFVTDTYNVLIGEKVKYYYPHLFQKTNLKREETQSSFTLADGRKILASTLGKNQRGHLAGESQDRPDFIVFEDFENSETIQSLVISENIWRSMEEAWNGRSIDGVSLYNCNYISKRRNVQRILDRARRSPEAHRVHIVPIMKDDKPTWYKAFTMEQIRQIERDSTDFQGEYMCNPSGTIDSFFSEKFLMLHPTSTELASGNGWHYFSKLNKTHQYILGVDPAGGNGGDYATIVVIDWTIRTVVAYFRDKWTNPEKLGDEASNKGTLFNKALVVVERNNHGAAVLLQMKHNKYSNLYEEINESEYVENYTEKLGFLSTATSKPAVLSALSSAINNFNIIIPIEVIRNEMLNFPREYVENAKQDAELGHFDLVSACFVKGTKVLTSKGQIDIEKLKVGDLVMTRDGYKPIEATISTYKRIVTNIGLTGTPDHPIFCNNNEIKDLQAVTKADTLYIWDSKAQKIERLYHTKVSPIIDILTQSYGIIDYISKGGRSGKSLQNIYKGKYGKIILEKYQMVLSYTIKMVTQVITKLLILKQYQEKNTLNTTCQKNGGRSSHQKISIKIERKLIAESLNTSKINPEKARCAFFALSHLKHLHTTQSIAQKNVQKDFLVKEEKNQQECMFVKLVRILLRQTNQTKKDVPKNVLEKSEPLKQEWGVVYNLQVKDTPEYFANNILVHNCSFAYQGRHQLTGKLSTNKYS